MLGCQALARRRCGRAACAPASYCLLPAHPHALLLTPPLPCPQGIKYIYTENIFIYAFLAFAGLTLIYVVVRGPDRWKRTKLEDVYAM